MRLALFDEVGGVDETLWRAALTRRAGDPLVDSLLLPAVWCFCCRCCEGLEVRAFETACECGTTDTDAPAAPPEGEAAGATI